MTLLRTEAFVPLTTAPAAGAGQDHRVTVIPDAKQFQALKSPEPSASAAATALAEAGPHPEKICEPRVTVQRDGDRVTHLRIQCTCGQIMDLACVYEPTAKPA